MKDFLKNIIRKINQEDKSLFKYVLSQNERNLPVAEELFNSFISRLDHRDFSFYPNTEQLKKKISKHHSTSVNNLLLTAGSDFAIKTIFETFNLSGKNIITTDYFFPMYQVYSELYQAELRKAEYNGMSFDTNKLVELIDKDTQFIILANPNSPLGDVYSIDQIKKLLDTGVYVVVDEAYIEFTKANSCIELIQEYRNLIVTRTFSKAYGAAGCRVGFLVSNQENIELLSKFRMMYEVSSVGAKYTEFILDNIEYFNKYISDTIKGKEQYLLKLQQQGFNITNTDASWFFIERFTDKDNLKYFNDSGMSLRTLILPDGKEYIKFNYDLILDHG